ncbi:MAG: cation:proton antiporter [Endomicrobiales bacterium]|nr:cation:proton antiporter [Endomicrobiales bacterium]
MNSLLGAGVIFLSGLLLARAFRWFKIPSITAYLILGIILGPVFLNVIPGKIISISGLISNFVLGIVAFSIGRTFHRENFRLFGRQVLWISILEAIGAWFMVTVILLIVFKSIAVAIVFGAIASATAPAATIMVIREYKARGPVTNTLLGVVAIDDAWCLIIFAISLAVSKAILFHQPGTQLMLINVFTKSIIEIIGAFFLGAILGLMLDFVGKILRTPEEVLTVSIGFIFVAAGISMHFNLSVLLTCMVLGLALTNIRNANEQFFESLQKVDTTLFLFFFVLAGANLEINQLENLSVMGVFYLIFRIIGKVGGAYIGGKISNASSQIQKYLGWGLVPQAGVALGCALVVKSELPEIGGLIFSTIVATTVIYEIFGPLCTKYALIKTGEIEEKA